MENQLAIQKHEIPKNLTLAEKTGLSILEQIKNTSLINESDINKFEISKKFAISTYTEVPQYRPMAIKLVSVLDDSKFPTPDSKYWQCKSETEVHLNELIKNFIKYERATIDIEEINYKISSMEKYLKGSIVTEDPVLIGFELRRFQVKKEEYLFSLKLLEKEIKYRIQEVTDWAAIAEDMKSKCKYSLDKHDEHFAESLYSTLKARVNEDPNSPLKSQLDTFVRLIKQK